MLEGRAKRNIKRRKGKRNEQFQKGKHKGEEQEREGVKKKKIKRKG